MMNQHRAQFAGKKNRRTILYFLGIVAAVGVIAISIYLLSKTSGPVCGNNACDYFETAVGCCKDCGCWGLGEVCNTTLNKCEKREIRISDERIGELVAQHFANSGKEIVSMNITSLITRENKLGKNVMVYVKGQEGFVLVIVMEDERVIEIY
jgi:hypothetical protein